MSKKKGLAQSAAMISIFTLLSKFLGFIREIMIAKKFGAGMETDTYFIAMTATIIIVGALGSALNTTLIPIFSEIGERYGKRGKLKYLNNIINLVLIITIIMAFLGFIFSPLIIKIIAKGFEGEQFELAVTLNRIGLPIIVFLGFTHIFSGILHSSEIFGPPAISGIPYNFVFLIYLLFFASNGSINTLMIVTVIAASTQFLILMPAVNGMGYRYSPKINLKDPYLKKAIILVLPVLLGSAVQQINVVIDKTLASELAEGSLSALTYSSRINDMVIAVFIMAITTVVFPMLSQAFSRDDMNQVRDIIGQGINIILLITVPATIGILVLGKPLIYLFFEGQAFGANATEMTSVALKCYSIGLVGSSLRLMLNRVYYSFQDTMTPMKNGIVAVVLNIILNLILVKPLGHGGLALATSISATVTTLLLFVDLKKRIGTIGLKRYLICFFKTLVASIIMGAIVYLIYFVIGALLPNKKILQLVSLVVSVLVGVVVYFTLCLLLKVDELKIIMKKL